jgi:hypothetical protein
MKLLSRSQIQKSFSCVAICVALCFVSTVAGAAELIMFEQTGCAWCDTFDREIAPIYPKTAEARRAPLRRVNIDQPLPQDLEFISVERLAPLFVLVDKGREIGRIRGYPGADNFWGLLGALIKTLDADATGRKREESREKSLHAAG